MESKFRKFAYLCDMDANHAAAEDLLKEALRRRAAGDRAAALAKLEAAAMLEPNRMGLEVERACELRALGHLDEAEAALDRILASSPDHVAALVERAHVKRRRGDRESALAGFAAASRAAPDNIPIRLEVVRDLRALDRLDAAEAELAKLVAADRSNVGAAIERGHVARQRGDHAKAAAAFAAATSAEPANGDVKLELARELIALGCLDDAELALNAIVSAHPAKVQAHFERARLARKRGDHPTALQALDAATAVAPAGVTIEARLQIAAELGTLGRYEAARRAVETALEEAGGDHAGAALQLGRIHRALGDHEQALVAFEAAAKDEARRAEALVEIARERWRLGAPREAGAALDAALARKPDGLEALLLKAEQALEAGRTDEALKAARRAVEAHPGALAPYLVGARAAAAAEPDEALRLLQRAEAARGALPEIAATRVHVLRLQSDNEAAGRALAAAEPMIGGHAGLWTEAASYAIANGDFAAASRWLDARPDDEPRTRARERALRGEMAQGRRDHEAASDHYRAAIAEGGGEIEWLERLAECRLLLADVDGARTAIAAAIKADAPRRKARGRSTNLSQHHLAQVMEELLLDPPALEEMQRIVALPAERQIEPLQALARRNPDNIGPALLLLNAMRRAGWFERALSAENDAAARRDSAPKRITQYWHDKTPPEDIARLMQTWRDANPDFEHIVLDSAAAEERLQAYGAKEALQAFRNADEIPQKADILRWAVLAFEGGFFVDADDRCLKPLADYVPAEASFVGYQERLGNLGSNFIGAAKNDPVIFRAFALACEAVNRGDRDMAWLASGAGLLTRAFAQDFIAAEKPQSAWRAAVFSADALNGAVGAHCPARYRS